MPEKQPEPEVNDFKIESTITMDSDAQQALVEENGALLTVIHELAAENANLRVQLQIAKQKTSGSDTTWWIKTEAK